MQQSPPRPATRLSALLRHDRRPTRVPQGWVLLAALLLTAGCGALGLGTAQPEEVVLVRLETALGPIDIEVYPERAPRMATNFLRYLDRGYYDGADFVRVESDAAGPDGNVLGVPMVQADLDPERIRFSPVLFERTTSTGLRHLDGTVSAMRLGKETVGPRFAICIGEQPDLDLGGRRTPDRQGFGAFGRVVSGMDVVHRIHASPSEGGDLTPPVPILSARRL